MKKKELSNKERAELTEEFIESDFYKDILLPEIQKEIMLSDKISSLNAENDEKIIESFRKQTVRRGVYQGLLDKFKTWIAQKNKRGGNDNG